MSHFVLSIASDMAKQIRQRFSLFLPMAWLGDCSLDDLSRGFLWLIVDNGTEKALFAKLRVRELQIEKGRSGDGLVVFGDQASSEYYYDQREEVRLNLQNHFALKPAIVTSLESDRVQEFEALVESSKKIVYKVPASIIQENSKYLLDDEDLQRTLARLESRYRKTKLFQSIPVTYAHPKTWKPYLSLAVAVIESMAEIEGEHVRSLAESVSESRSVGFDFDFCTIDEDDLKVREFSAPQGVAESNEILIKLQSAEIAHQRMLGELASISKSFGVNPQQSNSVDLLLEGADKIVICEVKSSSGINAASQCRKAIAQLVEYRYFISTVSPKSIQPVLIIEDGGNSEILDSYEHIMNSIGARVLRFRKGLDWPYRCPGFQELFKAL